MSETDNTIPAAAPAYTPPTEEKKAFLAALAKAQGAYEPIVRNRTVTIVQKSGSPYTFKYADMAEIIAKTRKALSDNGLALRSNIQHADDGVWLASILSHADGHEDVCTVFVAYGDDMKQFGGRLTYQRRYIGGPQLGVASEDDADEDGTDGRQDGGYDSEAHRRAPPPPQPAPRAPQRASAAKPEVAAPTGNVATATGEKMATDAQVKWLKDRVEPMDGEAADKVLAQAGVTDLNAPTAAAWAKARELLNAL